MTPEQSAEFDALLNEEHHCPNCTKTPMPEIGKDGYVMSPCGEHQLKLQHFNKKWDYTTQWRKLALKPLEEP
jgi:uncharacterized Zn finger protein (UPF0148 family)